MKVQSGFGRSFFGLSRRFHESVISVTPVRRKLPVFNAIALTP